jgi:hypothetical protein
VYIFKDSAGRIKQHQLVTKFPCESRAYNDRGSIPGDHRECQCTGGRVV